MGLRKQEGQKTIPRQEQEEDIAAQGLWLTNSHARPRHNER